MHKHHLHPCWKKIISLILQFWGLFQRPQSARPYRHFPLRPEMRGSSLAMGPALATCRSDRRETPQGAGTPQGKRGSPPSPRSPSASAPGGESWVKPRRRPRKGGGNASRPTPEKLTTTPPHVAPPNPVSLTKATAARAHHLVSPSPSWKHETSTTHLLSFVKPSPGIDQGNAGPMLKRGKYFKDVNIRKWCQNWSPYYE